MRVLHAALLMSDEPGIRRQMSWEQQAADELGLPWTSWPYESIRHVDVPRLDASPSPVDRLRALARRARASVPARRAFYEELVGLSSGYDLVLLRHSRHDPFRKSAAARLDARLASIHHTLEVPEIRAQGGMAGLVRAGLEGVLGPRALRASDAVVGVTREIADYERHRAHTSMPALVYPNGCLVTDADREAASVDARTDVPELLFVASTFAPWHGLDLLLGSLPSTSRQFVLHLVGRLAPADLRRAEADARVRLHGLLSADDLRAIARRCRVGLSSFGLARQRMTEACPLKVREYLSHGLPVYAGHHDVFPPDATFFRQGAPDLEQILDFAEAKRGTAPATTLEEAEPFIDKRHLLRRFYGDLVAALT